MIGAVIMRDMRLYYRRSSAGLAALGFYAAIIVLFPLALGPMPETLRHAAPAIVWIAVLLAALLTLEPLWHRDGEDGTFEAMIVSGVATPRIVIAKMISHWLAFGLPLALLSPVCAAMLQAPGIVLPLSVLIGTAYISLVGGFGAALTLGARRPGALIVLLVLPLCAPMLILGTLAASAALDDMAFRAYLLLQLALLVAALPLAPLAAAKVLDMHIRS